MLVKLSKEDKKRIIFFEIIFLVFLGTLIYSGILYAPFIYDDYHSIVDNDTLKNLKTTLNDISNTRYITNLSFAANYVLGGLNPFGYHLCNNLIHITNAILVYFLIVLTSRTPYMSQLKSSAPFMAFASALVFLVHPIQTQAVTYIAQRSTSLTTLFYLSSLVFYVQFRLKLITEHHRSGFLSASTLTYYSLCFLSAVSAMKSKEIAFTLPLMIILYEFSFFVNAHESRVRWKRFLFLLPLVSTFIIIPLSMLDITQPENTIAEQIDVRSRETVYISRTDYLITQARVVITYIRLLFFPAGQNFDYRYPIFRSFLSLEVMLSFLFLAVVLGLGIYLFYISRKRPSMSRLAAFGIFWFFIALSVESSIIPIMDVIVEHRLYLPSIGFFIACVSFFESTIARKKLKYLLLIVIVLLLSVSTHARNSLWKDPQRLWEDVVSKSPINARAHNEIGVIFRDKGQNARAIEQFEKALRINRNYPLTYYNLGDMQSILGNYGQALEYFSKTLSFNLSPRVRMDTLNSIGITHSKMGNDEEAIEAFKQAISASPTSIIPYNNLGRQYIKMGKPDQAIAILNTALSIRKSPHVYHNLSAAYALKEDNEKSRQIKQKALGLMNQ